MGVEHRRRPRQHHGLRRRARQRRSAAEPTATTRPARWTRTRRCRSPAAARPRATPATSTAAAGAFTIDQTTGNTFRPFDADTDLYNFGPANHYQRPDTRYSLGAMGHYELDRARGRLHAVDVHGLRVGRPDRSGRRLLRHQHHQLRQPAACPRSSGHDRLRRRGRSRRARSCRCTSRVATSKAAAASSVREHLVPRAARRSRRDLRELGLRRVGAVLEGQCRTSRPTTTSTRRV